MAEAAKLLEAQSVVEAMESEHESLAADLLNAPPGKDREAAEIMDLLPNTPQNSVPEGKEAEGDGG